MFVNTFALPHAPRRRHHHRPGRVHVAMTPALLLALARTTCSPLPVPFRIQQHYLKQRTRFCLSLSTSATGKR